LSYVSGPLYRSIALVDSFVDHVDGFVDADHVDEGADARALILAEQESVDGLEPVAE